MRKEKTLDFGHMTLRVYEPTMGGIRSILGREDVHFDPLLFLSGGCALPVDLVGLFTDASLDSLNQLTLSEFKEALDAIREMLSPFLEILELLGAVSGYLRGVQEATSTGRSAS